MGKNKENANDIKKIGPKTNDDQLGENATGYDRQDEVYKKEHHKKVK
ncbi:MAG: hypothetical protein N2448_03985 [Caloramator sp.]|nr:hypothetical protein [Caloramator sp.]